MFLIVWVGFIVMMGIGIYGLLIVRFYCCFGVWVILFVGIIICVVSLVVIFKVINFYLMYLIYGLLFGFGFGGIYLVIYIVVLRYFKKWCFFSLGFIVMGFGGGMFIMSLVVYELFVRFGWRGIFLVMVGIVFVICILVFVYKLIELDFDMKEENSDLVKGDKFWDVKIFE